MAVNYSMAALISLTRRHLQASGQLQIAVPNAEADVRLAVREVAETASRDRGLRPLVLAQYSLTFTAGVAPLPSTPEILRTSLPGAFLKIAGLPPFSWYNQAQDMERGTVRTPRWTLRGSNVVVRAADAIADGTVATLEACFVPVAGSTLDDELVPLVVQQLAQWWSGTGAVDGQEAPSA